jgi:hypothetical protein
MYTHDRRIIEVAGVNQYRLVEVMFNEPVLAASVTTSVLDAQDDKSTLANTYWVLERETDIGWLALGHRDYMRALNDLLLDMVEDLMSIVDDLPADVRHRVTIPTLTAEDRTIDVVLGLDINGEPTMGSEPTKDLLDAIREAEANQESGEVPGEQAQA